MAIKPQAFNAARNVAYGHARMDVSPWGFKEKLFLSLYRKGVGAIIEEVSGEIDGEGSNVQTLMRRLRVTEGVANKKLIRSTLFRSWYAFRLLPLQLPTCRRVLFSGVLIFFQHFGCYV